jgi:fibronectin-binding autotransporter adhesin
MLASGAVRLLHGQQIQLRDAALRARAATLLALAFAFSGITVGVASAASPPVNTGDPTITGTAEVGSTLNAAEGSWTGDPAPAYSYQWQRCEAALSPVVTTPFNSGPTLDDPRGIAVDSAGNVYTANYGSDTVSKFSPDGTPAGGPWPVSVGDGPDGIAIDSGGNVYTANLGDDTVSKITPAGVASTPLAIPPSSGNPAGPLSVTTDSAGNVYTANNIGDSVSKILPDFTLAGGPWPVSTGTGTYDITTDSAGNIYTANSTGSSVTKITPDGLTTNTIALTSIAPTGITTDSAGNIYTANLGSDNVSKILPGLTLAPAPWPASTTSGAFTFKITTDPAGNIYTTNSGANNVTKITPDGNSSTPFANTGSAPYDIASDSLGNLYTSNTSDENVTKITQVPCTDITGATASSYPLVGADEGKKVRVVVTANNGVGTAVIAASAPTATVGPDTRSAPANTAVPTISGTPEVGSALTADRGTWTGNPTPTYAYQWQRCDEGGNGCADIAGAASDTYTPASADEGKKLRIKVTATNSQGSSEALSAAVGPVPLVPGPTPPGPTPPGPTPPVPSSVFRVLSTNAVGSSAVTRVRVPGAGRLSQVGYRRTANAGSARLVIACRDARQAKGASTVTVRCRLDKAARRARRDGAVRIQLKITFTPSGGIARTATRTVVFRSLRPRYTG